jgi:hypothetical protein
LPKTGDQWHAGICLGQETACDPVAQTGCDVGQTCTVTGGGAFGGYSYRCEDAGSVAEGGDCSGDDVGCAEGLLCLSDVCLAPCDPGDDQCTTGTCQDISSAYRLSDGSIGVCTSE